MICGFVYVIDYMIYSDVLLFAHLVLLPLYITENSSSPSLSESMSIFHVVENNSTAFVGQVTATDSDGDDITFHLAGSDSYKLVLITNLVLNLSQLYE